MINVCFRRQLRRFAVMCLFVMSIGVCAYMLISDDALRMRYSENKTFRT